MLNAIILQMKFHIFCSNTVLSNENRRRLKVTMQKCRDERKYIEESLFNIKAMGYNSEKVIKQQTIDESMSNLEVYYERSTFNFDLTTDIFLEDGEMTFSFEGFMAGASIFLKECKKWREIRKFNSSHEEKWFVTTFHENLVPREE